MRGNGSDNGADNKPAELAQYDVVKDIKEWEKKRALRPQGE